MENVGPDGAKVGLFESTVASAATADIGGAANLRIQITGTVTITSFGTVANRTRFLRFAGALTLTHHATSLVLPGAANIATAAGDTAIATSDGSGNWRVIAYQKASVAPGAGGGGGGGGAGSKELLPFAVEFPSSGYPSLLEINRRPVLSFWEDGSDTCFWTFVAPQGMAGALSAVIYYFMDSATSGKVDFQVAIEAVTPGDALDLDATTSFDTANAITAPTVPGTAGYMGQIACTLSNADGVAAGDMVRLRLVRDGDDATNDTASGSCNVLAVDFRWAG